MLTVTAEWLRATTGSSTVRWSPSTRWVIDVLRASTTLEMEAASEVAIVTALPYPSAPGALAMVGRWAAKYGG